MNPTSITPELITAQYKTADNLNARIQLHERFSTNPYPWFAWVFDRLLRLPPNSRIIELGCGSAELWRKNLHRIPPGWQITLTDASQGMIDHASQNLAGAPGFTFEIADAESLAFEDAAFDGVVANHMLYHVSNRQGALAHIQRVLKPGGTFFAATNGETHMMELYTLIDAFLPGINAAQISRVSQPFSLENGREQIAPWFASVNLERYEDSCSVPEAEPLVAYVLSMIGVAAQSLNSEIVSAFRQFVQDQIAAKGAIHITKAGGIFIAQKATL